MAKKKIVHIVEAFGGGIFTYLVELTNSLCDDFDIVIAYAKRKQTPKNFEEYFDKRIKFVEIRNFTRSINPIKDIKAGIEIYKLIKKENPDIIHMHSSKAGIIGRLVIKHKTKIKEEIAGTKENKVKNRKLFYTPHGYAFLKQDDSKIKRAIYKMIEKIVALLNRNCKIVACSKGEYEESLKLLKSSTYINNGINTNKIDELVDKSVIYKTNIHNLKICIIGRIGYQKNPQLFNRIAEQFPHIQFTWIGDGELRSTLTSKNIKIIGWVERKAVLNELEKNDIFILPSLWEGLPIALLEAMYLKKLCIVSNVIGNKDVIENGRNGFICENFQDYINIIQQVQNEKYNLDEIEENANKDILKEYNIKVMCEKYEKMYM